MSLLPQWLLGFVCWVLLCWPLDAHTRTLQQADLLAGAFVALFVALATHGGRGGRMKHVLDPRRWGWGVVFALVLAVHVVRANLDVARRVLSPSLPIRPGIVRIETRLTSASAQAVLANAITLTPGTLTVDVGSEPGVLYVHWIDVEQQDVQQATQCIAGQLERLIGKLMPQESHA